MVIFCLVGALYLGGCFEKTTAGTSTGTENPEIAVVIEGSGSAGITGNLNLYRSGQNPLVDPEPFLSLRLEGDSEIVILKEDLESVVSDGEALKFNIVLEADSIGQISEGFGYDPESKILEQGNEKLNTIHLNGLSLVSSSIELHHPPAEYDVEESPLYLFVPGSPYFTHRINNGFSFDRLPPTDFSGQVLLKNGDIYTLEERIFAQAGQQGTHTAELSENIDIGDADNLISHVSKPLIIDTITHRLNLSDFCDVTRHPHAIVKVYDSSIVSIENTDTNWNTHLKLDTWANINDDDLVSSNKILYYSYRIGEDWVSTIPRHEVEDRDGYCGADKPFNKDVRIDSVYFFEANSWNLELKVIFTNKALEHITHSIENEKGEIEELWRDPPNSIPDC